MHFLQTHDKFKELYEQAEANRDIRKKTMRASELFAMFMEERKNTGSAPPMNVDCKYTWCIY